MNAAKHIRETYFKYGRGVVHILDLGGMFDGGVQTNHRRNGSQRSWSVLEWRRESADPTRIVNVTNIGNLAG